MRWSLPFLLSLLPLSGLAGKPRKLRSRQCKQSNLNSTIRNAIPGQTFTLQTFYQGNSFFEDWEFFTGDDPTHGNVNYLSREDAQRKKLAFINNDGAVVLSVDATTQLSPNYIKRDSVRIKSKATYNGGLFIADFAKMPHGCSLWPAYWSVGPDWPANGEIDIIEGVNTQPTNQMTLHTGDTKTGESCYLPQSASSSADGTLIRTSCATIGMNNEGCAFLDKSEESYGEGFNNVGGGVYAHLWNEKGITVWRFSRNNIPQDITNKTPNPSSWPRPVAYFPSTNCNMATFFSRHNLVLDTTLCGDWAGGAYPQSKCPLSCAEYVLDPNNFIDAQWVINYIAVYQLST